MSDLDGITDWTVVRGGVEKEKDGSVKIDSEEMSKALKGRVKGQEHVIDDLCILLKRQWAKEKRKRPIANLLFLGPTATGKTELAKALAEYLYKGRMLRFDCSELHGHEGKTRLIGTPAGYVAADKGGELTRAVINNKKQIILFDEIEKAFSGVFDLFLQMMDDARLTEQGSGKTADFTDAIIILTSNAEYEAICKIQEQISDYQEMVNSIKSHLTDTKVFRAEIVGRIDRVYVFKPLKGMVVAEIAALKMVNAAKEYGLTLKYVDPKLILEAMDKGNKLSRFGVRELERVIGDMFGEAFVAAKEEGASVIRMDITADGTLDIQPA